MFCVKDRFLGSISKMGRHGKYLNNLIEIIEKKLLEKKYLEKVI